MSLPSELVLALDRLRRAIEAESVKDMDQILTDIYPIRDPSVIAPLLALLRDDFKYQEGMWTVMQAAESFDPQTYVKALVRSMQQVVRDAPDWADTLLARVLNGKDHLAAMYQEFQRTSDDQRAAVLQVFDRLRQDAPGQFDQRINDILGKCR